MRVGLDTNVLVYARGRTTTFHITALRTLYHYQELDAELCITPQVVREFMVVMNKQNLPQVELMDKIRDITTSYTLLPETPAVLPRFLSMVEAHNIRGRRIYDAWLAATLLENGVTSLLTWNHQDFAPLEGELTLLPTDY